MSPNNLFQCRNCQVSFNKRSNCTRHEKICTTEQSVCEQFTCDKCSRSFSRKDNLRKHVPKCSGSTVSSRNYVPNKKKTPCLVPNCGLQFQHRTVLIEHLAVAHPSKVAFKPKVSKTFSCSFHRTKIVDYLFLFNFQWSKYKFHRLVAEIWGVKWVEKGASCQK
uniref:Zinc finger and BTB domain-containing protein 45 n=1 Tax=Cacopsylla melanoneura TaxID=428564 RepID=A0A8D8LF17_9HEMI